MIAHVGGTPVALLCDAHARAILCWWSTTNVVVEWCARAALPVEGRG